MISFLRQWASGNTGTNSKRLTRYIIRLISSTKYEHLIPFFEINLM